MRLWVTGGAGYIGSVVAAELVRGGHDVIVVDDLSAGHLDAVPPGSDLHCADVRDIGAVMRHRSIDAVLHLAARSLVGESVIDPSAYWHANVGRTLALLDAMRDYGIPRIVFSSTAATYGEPAAIPIFESQATKPASPYGASKLAVDLALGCYARAYGLAAVSLRYFNVAGALHQQDGKSYGERHDIETHLISLALRVAAGESETLRVFGSDYPTPDGTGIRDYIHVVDVADAHARALTFGGTGEHHILKLGGGTGYSVLDVINTVEAVTGLTVPIDYVARRAGDAAVLLAANDRAADDLGWRPQRDLTAMVEDAWHFMIR